MQDSNEEFIHEREEKSDQLIHEKEEQNEEWEWEPKSEKIEGQTMSKMMSRPKAPHLCIPKDLLNHRNANRPVGRSC